MGVSYKDSIKLLNPLVVAARLQFDTIGPANIYLLKAAMEKLAKGVKYVQS